METRIILAALCFTMSFLSLIRGYYLIKAEQQQSATATNFITKETFETLKLLFFNGIKSRNGLVLIFKTGKSNCHYTFEIERKDEAGNYETIHEIERPQPDKSYKFVDRYCTPKHVEYRIRQTDAFGIVRASRAVIVKHC